ncbi:TetR/AcrR family transcriptional regulator C-terminal domain-containing protein [Polymorphospora rubra]|uniref:TetR family transcriptional regulator n=1 Tax=Polymorphospora rubra TaxID=338584 RepID=A0A810NFF3_9ACTN|nr:TetR/AcrR family transcriptional regulator C-terminal domain-containing protein [Polymorphospora rubra]BCJ70173.1 TetR family transcriptional regulator [Polymorphospora rubra]
MSSTASEGPLRGLPPVLLSAWGIAQNTTKGPKPRWSLDQILSTAVALGDAHGVEAITMSRVAKTLGGGTMSMYRYVQSREDLLVLAADAALGRPPRLEAEESWRASTHAWVTAMRDTYRSHPWLSSLPITGEALMPSYVRWMEAGLGCLEEAKLPGEQAVSVLTLLWTYVRSDVELGAGLAGSLPEGARTAHQVNAYLAERLRVADRHGEFPRLRALLESEGPTDGEESFDDTDFALAIDVILDGVEARRRR